MLKRILVELKNHAPFTLVGAFSGIVLMFIFKSMTHHSAHTLFYIFHPMHIFLSAIVTTAIFKLYYRGPSAGISYFLKIVVIGYIGSVGVGTLSDSLIPYAGELLLDLPHSHAHIGFIDGWWIVNPAAFAGIAIGYFRPTTKLPHSGHVLLSTWASLFHMVMALGISVMWYDYAVLFVFLFVSVWLPCCFSDIAFPLFFIRSEDRASCKIEHGCGCGCR